MSLSKLNLWTLVFFVLWGTITSLQGQTTCPKCSFENGKEDRYCIECMAELYTLSQEEKELIDQKNEVLKKKREKELAYQLRRQTQLNKARKAKQKRDQYLQSKAYQEKLGKKQKEAKTVYKTSSGETIDLPKWVKTKKDLKKFKKKVTCQKRKAELHDEDILNRTMEKKCSKKSSLNCKKIKENQSLIHDQKSQ